MEFSWGELGYFIGGLVAVVLAWLSPLIKQKHDNEPRKPLRAEIRDIALPGWLMLIGSVAVFAVFSIGGCNDKHVEQAKAETDKATEQAARKEEFDKLNAANTALIAENKAVKALAAEHQKQLKDAIARLESQGELLNLQNGTLGNSVSLMTTFGLMQTSAIAGEALEKVDNGKLEQTAEYARAMVNFHSFGLDHWRNMAESRSQTPAVIQAGLKGSLAEIKKNVTDDLSFLDAAEKLEHSDKIKINNVRSAAKFIQGCYDDLDKGAVDYVSLINLMGNVRRHLLMFQANTEWVLADMRQNAARKNAPKYEKMFDDTTAMINALHETKVLKPVVEEKPVRVLPPTPVER